MTAKVDGKSKRLCEDCAALAAEGQQIAEKAKLRSSK